MRVKLLFLIVFTLFLSKDTLATELELLDFDKKDGYALVSKNQTLTAEKNSLTKMLHQKLGNLQKKSDIQKVKILLAHIADVSLLEYRYYGTDRSDFRALNIYLDMTSRKVGHLCNGLANVFIGALEIFNIPYRRIRGQSIIPSHPHFKTYITKYGTIFTHSTVEVFIDGKWILADPTYNGLPHIGYKYIGLDEGINEILRNNGKDIRWEYVNTKIHWIATTKVRRNYSLKT